MASTIVRTEMDAVVVMANMQIVVTVRRGTEARWRLRGALWLLEVVRWLVRARHVEITSALGVGDDGV